MFDKNYVGQLIDRSAEHPADRRRFLSEQAPRWGSWDP
jgi:hypothetical protein